MILSYYPTIDDDVEPLHAFVMEGFDRAPEKLINRAALEAALQRPQSAAHYEGADLATQIARLIIGIAVAHAYPDGNKRTALIVGDTFAQNNGYWIACQPVELARQLLAAVTHETSEETFVEWLRERLMPTDTVDPETGTGSAYAFTIDFTDATWGTEPRLDWEWKSVVEKRAEFRRLVEQSWDTPVTFSYGTMREFNATRIFIVAEPEPGLYQCRAIARIGPPAPPSKRQQE
ncbi:MAG: type II toxin-antitoxin system death-on-curing family toxin [Chloroflexia bacterium]